MFIAWLLVVAMVTCSTRKSLTVGPAFELDALLRMAKEFSSLHLFCRYGTCHVVATNIILWLRTLIRESLEEISEVEEEHERDLQLHANETEIVGFVFERDPLLVIFLSCRPIGQDILYSARLRYKRTLVTVNPATSCCKGG